MKLGWQGGFLGFPGVTGMAEACHKGVAWVFLGFGTTPSGTLGILWPCARVRCEANLPGRLLDWHRKCQ